MDAVFLCQMNISARFRQQFSWYRANVQDKDAKEVLSNFCKHFQTSFNQPKPKPFWVIYL